MSNPVVCENSAEIGLPIYVVDRGSRRGAGLKETRPTDALQVSNGDSADRFRLDLTLCSVGPYIQCRYMAATTTQIAKWGNSLGVRLPKSVAQEAEVDEGDRVDVSVKNGAIVIRRSRPRYSLEQLVAKINPRNRHDETDWGVPVGHETW